MQYTVNSAQQTQQIGKNLAAKLNGGNIVLLYGELGAGKTTLVKGIAKGLGVKEKIKSPTFSLMNVYNLRIKKNTKLQKLIHIDTYRLKNEQELLEIGAEDYIGAPHTITIIEWPAKIVNLLKKNRSKRKILTIKLEYFKNKRKIKI